MPPICGSFKTALCDFFILCRIRLQRTIAAFLLPERHMDPEAVRTAVTTFSDFLLRYFVALAAVGALAMALIELAKKIHDTRTRYHARQVLRWVMEEFGSPASPHALACLTELLQLTTGLNRDQAQRAAGELMATQGTLPGLLSVPTRREYSVFALELEKMMGHIQDASDTALNDPKAHPALFQFITSGVRAEDVEAWHAFIEATTRAPVPMAAAASAERNPRRDADLYTRLQQSVRRKLDAFQLFCGMRWANRNQLWANVVGVVVLANALWWITLRESGGTSMNVWEILVASLAGGVLAPLAKDMVVALQRVRSA